MTKLQAKQLDLLLKYLVIPENKEWTRTVDVRKVCKKVDGLKDLSKEEIKDLLYIIRLEQSNRPKLFDGTNLLHTNDESINDFLRSGGFISIYNSRLKKRVFEVAKFIIPAITLGILIWSNFIKESDLKPKKENLENTKSKESKQEPIMEKSQEKNSTDSKEIHYHKAKTLDSLGLILPDSIESEKK
ncbi:hypothetical protein VBZ51_09455 [Maribacter sp. HS]|uniref:hypothetical protein n=1 Tax=Maribacter sp. HS TaxID=3110480 RepID=UPI003A86D0BD